MIRSALRPAAGEPSNPPLSVRLLHEQYDQFFKSVVTGNWCDSSDGDVEAPTGYFSFISVEYNEAEEFWEANASYPELSDCQMKVLWSGMLAGYYLTTEDSNGIIRVYAYDERSEALKAYAGLEKQYSAWIDDYDAHN